LQHFKLLTQVIDTKHKRIIDKSNFLRSEDESAMTLIIICN